MDQLPQRAFVGSVGIHRVETPESQPAQRAAAGFIQRKAVDERHSAGDAEIFHDQRRWLRKTAAANRDSGKLLEGFAANAAIVGENDAGSGVEQAAGYPFRDATDAVCRNKVAPTREQATRENSPPSPNLSFIIPPNRTGSAAADRPPPAPCDPKTGARASPVVRHSSCRDKV